jgi:hypothetical protein
MWIIAQELSFLSKGPLGSLAPFIVFSLVMTIWKWLLAQTTIEGFLLKELLLSYDESYVPKVDIEGMINVKKKKIQLH